MRLFSLVALLIIYSFSDTTPTKHKKKIDKPKKPPPPNDLVIQSLVETEGCDPSTQPGNVLHVHYIGRIYETDQEFDNTYERSQPFEFVLGEKQVIKGWDQVSTPFFCFFIA